MSRSGTTLLSRMLDAHPDIAIFPETWWYVVLDRLGCLEEFSNPWQTSLFFNEVWKSLTAYRDPAARVLAREASQSAQYVGPTAPLLEKLGRAYARERNARIWGEKTPGHALWLPQIQELFPNARVLFSVRDPRDVLVSYDERWNQGRLDTDYLISTAALLKLYMTRLLNAPGFPPDQIYWVKYESLAAQPAEQLEQICDFLGVKFDPSMLSFHRRHANVERDMAEGQHHALLSKPATTDHIGRHERALSASQTALVERLLGNEMDALGYPLSNHTASFSSEEMSAYAKAEDRYQRMAAGEVRQEFRRKGKWKLRAYQTFGRALDIVPRWRIVTTEKEWLSQTEETPNSAATSSTSDAPAALDEAKTSEPTAPLSFKTEMGRISRQSGVAFAGTVFTAALGYGFKVYLARVLGAEALGLYALGITIISFLGMINVLGLPESAVRFVALYSASKKYEELRELVWNGSWILMATNLAFAALLLWAGPWFAIRFYHAPQLARYLPLFAPIMITSALNHFFGNVLAGYREVGRRTLVTKFVASPVTILVSVLLISLGAGLWGYLVAQIVSAVCVMCLLIAMMWSLTPVEARSPNWKQPWIGREVWSFSAAMFGLGLAVFFVGQIDRVALGIFRTAKEVGIYSVAAGLITYEVIILQSVNQIFAPVIADVHSRGEHVLLGRLFQTLTKWILGLTIPLAIVVIAFAKPIMRIFGPDFEAGWPILIIGTIGQLANCGVGSVGYMLLMSGNQRRLLRVQLVMAVVMVVLSFKLVPAWGALGAAVAAAVTTIGANGWNLIEVRRALNLSPYNRSYFKLLISAIGVLAVTLLAGRISNLLRMDFAGIMAALILAYAVFGTITLATGLDEDDHLILDAVWARMRGLFGA